MLLQYKDTQFFKVKQIKKTSTISLQVSGLVFHSSLAVDRIEQKIEDNNLIILVHLVPARKGLTGNFNYTFDIPPNVQFVRFGPSKQVIWKHNSEKTTLPIAKTVTLSGVMQMKSFTHPNTGKAMKIPVLILDKPVNVSADTYGDAKENIHQIQLAFHANYNQYQLLKKTYLHKKVSVTGTLQHAMVATQHYTDVYMEVDSIVLSGTNTRQLESYPIKGM